MDTHKTCYCQQLQAGQLNDLLTLHLIVAPLLQKITTPHLGKAAAQLLLLCCLPYILCGEGSIDCLQALNTRSPLQLIARRCLAQRTSLCACTTVKSISYSTSL